MKIDDKMIEELAQLARLEFDRESKEEIKKDLNKILEFVEKLNELDTKGVEPLIYLSDETNVMRDDEPTLEVNQKEALKNAPDKDSDYFKVPKVIDNPGS